MWNRFLTVVCLAASIGLFVAGCGASEESDGSDDSASPAAETATVPDSVNALTTAERDDGWTLLFDGQSMDRWRIYGADSMADDWVVENGTMHYTGAADDAPDDIITREQYGNFDLRFEWKISEGGNSGVMFHVSEEHKWPWQSGPEYQILDNENHSNGEDPLTSAGANYALHPPAQDVTKPHGAWNESRIVVRDGHVEHYLNGTKLLEYDLGSDAWTQKVNETKFGEMPGYGQYDTGHICLQDHTDPVWFRDVKIRRLDASENA